MADYWKRRDLIERTRLFDLTEAQLEKLLKIQYLRIYKEVRQQLLDLINSLPQNPTADQIYREDKFYKLLSELQFKLDNLGNFEKDHMTDTFKDYFIKNAQQTDVDFNLPIDNERVVRAINNVWAGDGQNFSDRIWKDKRLLLERLKTGLIDTITTGRNWGSFSKQLQKEFGTSYNNARRLIRTELSHIQNESSLYKYEAEGVEQVKFIVEKDNRLCPICRKYGDKIYDIKNAPRIPVHPNCRCTYIPVVKI